MTEIEKMIAGEKYDALDAEIIAQRMRAHDLCHALSLIKPSDLEGKNAIMRELLPNAPKSSFITPPFFCDYGWNITLGKQFYCNTGCVILDGAPVKIGEHVLLAPNVHIYTATHAINPDERSALIQWTEPVCIGNKVWVGGNSTICPGVTIGDGSIIGAGSVVTKDIPANVVAGGSPCRIIREI